MEIREITNKEEWEGFLARQAEKTFLQSWNWGEFCARGALASGGNLPGKIWRFGAYDAGNLLAVALVVKISARRGIFLFIPHGPVLAENLPIKDKKEILQILLVHLSNIAIEEKASFIRVAPLLADTQENRNIFVDLGSREAPMHSSAYEATWKLDISAPEEALLANMRKTTRYLIKKASENPDISVEISRDPKDIEVYQKLNKEVARRQRFVPFSDEFIKNEFEVFGADNQAIFIFGKYKGEVACGALVIFWSGIGFYHQAASLAKFAEFSIPYLLQWKSIQTAKIKNCATYDFWGFTDPQKFPRHPWAGPTLFKTGFSGYKTEYIKTQDFVISQKYWINYIIEKTRKFYRGL